MKSLRGKLVYVQIGSYPTTTRIFFILPVAGNNKYYFREVVDLNPGSPTFGAKATVGEIVELVRGRHWAKGVKIKITKMKIRVGDVLIFGIPYPQEEGDEERVFRLSDFSLPNIFPTSFSPEYFYNIWLRLISGKED